MPNSLIQAVWYIFIAIIGGSGVYFFERLPFPQTKQDIVNGKWYLLRNDADNQTTSGQLQRVQTIWTGKYLSKKGFVNGDLTDQTKTVLGVTDSKTIDGVVSGVLRAELLSLSYGSRDTEGAGSGAWLLKRQRDGEKTFVGQAFGYDCNSGRVTRCPAMLTQNIEYALKKYKADFAEACTEIPLDHLTALELDQTEPLQGTSAVSTCPIDK